MSAEYVLAQGNHKVILCERGVRSFEDSTRNMMDLSAIPNVQGQSHLPIIADPSHATGRPDLIPAMARASIAAGADGVHIEVHTCPEKALSVVWLMSLTAPSTPPKASPSDQPDSTVGRDTEGSWPSSMRPRLSVR